MEAVSHRYPRERGSQMSEKVPLWEQPGVPVHFPVAQRASAPKTQAVKQRQRQPDPTQTTRGGYAADAVETEDDPRLYQTRMTNSAIRLDNGQRTVSKQRPKAVVK